MLRHRIYYGLKPFVPRSIRLGIRRWFAIRKREHVRDVWPIMPASERGPEHWPGWPDGKQFALVLTHDVEGKAGLRKCRELMRLEQQPEGRHTIFPFWVPARGARQPGASSAKPSQRPCPTSGPLRAGYVELPYTLPQDFTLFLLLREHTPDIWLQKLDWIARHGGMALVNVHPDYLCFSGATPKAMEYPSAHYKAFLEYVSRHYEGLFWNTTPRNVAQFFADATKVPVASEV